MKEIIYFDEVAPYDPEDFKDVQPLKIGWHNGLVIKRDIRGCWIITPIKTHKS